jgi:hypothetical protein
LRVQPILYVLSKLAGGSDKIPALGAPAASGLA